MRNHFISVVVLAGAALPGCRTPEPAAVSTPAPASLPSPEAATLPAPTGSVAGELVYDHRGAYGPLRVEQLELALTTATAHCRRLPASQPLEETTVVLEASEVEVLRGAIATLLDATPTAARRPALAHDLGVMTLTLRDGDRVQSLVVDGATTLDPYPDPLLRQVIAIKGRCRYGEPAAESASPGATAAE